MNSSIWVDEVLRRINELEMKLKAHIIVKIHLETFIKTNLN